MFVLLDSGCIHFWLPRVSFASLQGAQIELTSVTVNAWLTKPFYFLKAHMTQGSPGIKKERKIKQERPRFHTKMNFWRHARHIIFIRVYACEAQMLCSVRPEMCFLQVPPDGLDPCALPPLTGLSRGLRSFMNFPRGRKWLVMQNELNSPGDKGYPQCDDSIYCGKFHLGRSAEVRSQRIILSAKTPFTGRGDGYGLGGRGQQWDSLNRSVLASFQIVRAWVDHINPDRQDWWVSRDKADHTRSRWQLHTLFF